jgi:hypothetical protein
MPFEKYAVIDCHKHVFKEEPDLYWLIKPPTIADEISLSRFYQEGRIRMIDNQRIVFPWSNIEIACHQLALLFGGTNITKEGTDQLVLPDNSRAETVEKYLGSLPTSVVKELWEALGEAVPGWGPGETDNSKN